MSYTANKWTDDEKSYVISKFKSGKSIDDIATSGKITRSKYAIELKVYNTIYDMLQMGMTHDEVAEEFNRSKKEIINIEKKIFDMKQNDDKSKVKHEKNTPYYNDGGYKYTDSNISSLNIDFNDIHHFNRTMHIVLNFYENIDRLNTLKKNKIIDDDFYNDLIKKTKEFVIDKNKILSILSEKNIDNKVNKDIIDTQKSKKINNNNDDDNDNDNDTSDTESVSKKYTEKPIKKSFKSSKNDDGDDGKYDELPKKLKKRLF